MSKFCPRHPTPSTAHQPGNVNLNLIPLGPTDPDGQRVYVYLNVYVPLNYNISGHGKGLGIGTIGTINPCLRRSSFRTCLELLINGWSGSQNVVYPLEVRRFFLSYCMIFIISCYGIVDFPFFWSTSKAYHLCWVSKFFLDLENQFHSVFIHLYSATVINLSYLKYD